MQPDDFYDYNRRKYLSDNEDNYDPIINLTHDDNFEPKRRYKDIIN